MINKRLKYDWGVIQKFYDDGHTWKNITEHFGISGQSIYTSFKKGRLKVRSKSEAKILHDKKFGAPKHSQKTKEKLSLVMREYFEKNPDKVGYRMNHSSKKSYPEIIFENALMASNITGWIYSYNCGIYRYDFAFVDKKIDVEIDGKTHLQDNVKKIDERRDAWSKSNGWKVIRFTASRVKTDVVGCINELKTLL